MSIPCVYINWSFLIRTVSICYMLSFLKINEIDDLVLIYVKQQEKAHTDLSMHSALQLALVI